MKYKEQLGIKVIPEEISGSSSTIYQFSRQNVLDIAEFLGDEEWEYNEITFTGKVQTGETYTLDSSTIYCVRSKKTNVDIMFYTNESASLFSCLAKKNNDNSFYNGGYNSNYTGVYNMFSSFINVNKTENGFVLDSPYTGYCTFYYVSHDAMIGILMNNTASNDLYSYYMFNGNKNAGGGGLTYLYGLCLKPYVSVFALFVNNTEYAFLEFNLNDGKNTRSGMHIVCAGPYMDSAKSKKFIVCDGKVYVIFAYPASTNSRMFAFCLGEYA